MQHPIGLTAAERGRRVGRLAEAIAACAAARIEHFGHVTAAGLTRDGFTAAEIAEHLPAGLLSRSRGGKARDHVRPTGNWPCGTTVYVAQDGADFHMFATPHDAGTFRGPIGAATYPGPVRDHDMRAAGAARDWFFSECDAAGVAAQFV